MFVIISLKHFLELRYELNIIIKCIVFNNFQLRLTRSHKYSQLKFFLIKTLTKFLTRGNKKRKPNYSKVSLQLSQEKNIYNAITVLNKNE